MINILWLSLSVFIFVIIKPVLQILSYCVKLLKLSFEKLNNPVKEMDSKDVC